MSGSRATLLFVTALLVAVLVLVLSPPANRAPSLHIAAASSFRATLPVRITAYTQANPGPRIEVTYAASGTLAAAIERGAPYDLFLSADDARSTHLEKLGLLTSAGVQPLAASRVVLIRGFDPDAPDAPGSPKLAIPNPAFAPFGQAAKAWLDTHPDFGSHTLIFADSVANAAGLFRAGAVDGAFVDAPHAAQLAASGPGFITPLDDAPTITLTAGVMKASSRAAEAEKFIAFLRERGHPAAP